MPLMERAEAMKQLYYDAEETIPNNMPEPRDKDVRVNIFVDADHAEDKLNHRSYTTWPQYNGLVDVKTHLKR